MDKLVSLWMFVRKNKYLITILVFAVIVVFLDENSILRRVKYAHEEQILRSEIENIVTSTKKVPAVWANWRSIRVPSNAWHAKSI